MLAVLLSRRPMMKPKFRLRSIDSVNCRSKSWTDTAPGMVRQSRSRTTNPATAEPSVSQTMDPRVTQNVTSTWLCEGSSVRTVGEPAAGLAAMGVSKRSDRAPVRNR